MRERKRERERESTNNARVRETGEVRRVVDWQKRLLRDDKRVLSSGEEVVV